MQKQSAYHILNMMERNAVNKNHALQVQKLSRNVGWEDAEKEPAWYAEAATLNLPQREGR